MTRAAWTILAAAVCIAVDESGAPVLFGGGGDGAASVVKVDAEGHLLKCNAKMPEVVHGYLTCGADPDGRLQVIKPCRESKRAKP